MLRMIVAIGFLALPALAAEPDYPHGQLPTTVTPTHYALDLKIVPSDPTFSGTASIDVKLEKPTSLIWLHGRELNVTKAEVVDAGGAVIQATWTEIPDSFGVVKLALAKEAKGPTAKINVTYSAKFNENLEGVYRVNEGGEAYIFTQMEPFDARRGFPSFDEPRFKTPFDLKLTVRKNDAFTANAPVVKREELPGDLARITFQETKPLPTYLVALAVGPFDVVSWEPVAKTAVRDRPVPLRGFTSKGKGEQIKYALSHTGALLTTLESYFGIPYPFEKLDIIAAPDFSAGAMENAGAIVYREQLMLMDERSPLSTKRRYAVVHAHEMAHQWFGDLVTPAWWNDIWLNEAFATWMEHKVTDAWDPKGEYSRDGLRDAIGAMAEDSHYSSRRITQPIEGMGDINNAFDGITYEKGNGVIAMFEHYYGVENFRKGVQNYLNSHAYGTGTSREFFDAIGKANNDTKGIAAFESFTNQAGVPLVEAELVCDAKGVGVNVKQRRYFPASSTPNDGLKWQWKIPICIAYGDGTTRDQDCSLLEQQTARLPLKAKTCPKWIMPNADGAAYMRFALTDKGWNALLAAHDQINDREVLSALDSLSAALGSGRGDAAMYLDGVKAIFARSQVAWDIAQAPRSRITSIVDDIVPEDTKPAARKYVMDLYGPLYAKLGLDPTSAFDKSSPLEANLMRPIVVSMVATHGRDPAARKELAARGARYLGLTADGKPGDGKLHPEVIDANIVDTAVFVAAEEMAEPVFNAVTTHLKTERDGTIRQRLLYALNFITDKAVTPKVRAMILRDDLRVNERPQMIGGLATQKANVADGWAWFKDHFDALVKKTPLFGQERLVNIGGAFCSAAERADYVAFFDKRINTLQGAQRNYNAIQEEIATCMVLKNAQQAKVVNYLTKR